MLRPLRMGMCTASSIISSSSSGKLKWEPARFQGATITVDGTESFDSRLSETMKEIRADNRKGVWMKVNPAIILTSSSMKTMP